MRVAVFVVAYNAEAHIRETLRRIPADLMSHLAAIYVIDDSSVDRTTEVAGRLKAEVPGLEVFTTPFNQGYGETRSSASATPFADSSTSWCSSTATDSTLPRSSHGF